MEIDSEIKETAEQLKHYQGLLKDPECDFTTQTWIELQIKELKKWLKELRKRKANSTPQDPI